MRIYLLLLVFAIHSQVYSELTLVYDLAKNFATGWTYSSNSSAISTTYQCSNFQMLGIGSEAVQQSYVLSNAYGFQYIKFSLTIYSIDLISQPDTLLTIYINEFPLSISPLPFCKPTTLVKDAWILQK